MGDDIDDVLEGLDSTEEEDSTVEASTEEVPVEEVVPLSAVNLNSISDSDTLKELKSVDTSNKDKVTIIIEESQNEADSTQVFVGVNGKDYLIKRGEPVAIPVPVFNALKDAVAGKLVKQVNGEYTLRHYPRYPMRVVNQ